MTQKAPEQTVQAPPREPAIVQSNPRSAPNSPVRAVEFDVSPKVQQALQVDPKALANVR
jgi:hypothetical protein